MSAEPVDLRAELAQMGKIADPDRAAADLVFIGRTDAAPGGADLALSARILTQRIEVAMEGEDERAIIGYLQGFRGDGYALGGELLDFRSEEHTSELQSLMRISYAVFCLK